jgi:hypothetical protein
MLSQKGQKSGQTERIFLSFFLSAPSFSLYKGMEYLYKGQI